MSVTGTARQIAGTMGWGEKASEERTVRAQDLVLEALEEYRRGQPRHYSCVA